MASNINPTNIDITFPIAGQDNDTQGFRDNFRNIKNNLSTAKSEITNLQSILGAAPQIVNPPVSLTSGGTAGQVAYDANYFYVCTATNTWTKIPNTSIAYSNANIAAYLPTYTGNISAGNLNVTSVTYTNQEIVNTTEVVTGNLTIGGIVTGNTTTFTGNIITNQKILANSLTVTSAIQFANLTTAQINTISTPARGMTVYNYNTGNIQVYNGTKWANITLS
jgi:hypothetical protein